jgi:hypothetical protein
MIKMSKEIQDSKNYLCIRIQLIRVKRGWLGISDEILAFNIVTPDTEKLTLKVYKKLIHVFERLIEKYMPDAITLQENK